MSPKIALPIAFIVGFISLAGAQELNLSISSPHDKAAVTQQPVVEGTVSDPRAIVSVIVHPMAVGDYWVQQNVTVRKNGAWRVQINVGRPGTVDVGKHFEIMAVANPKTRLKEGVVLSGWPDSQSKSEVMEVTSTPFIK